jgi:SMODS and SLOG-associating 2TM effector domain 2
MPDEPRGWRAWLSDLARFRIRRPPLGIDDLKIWRHRRLSTALPFPALDWAEPEEENLKALYDYVVHLAYGVIDWYIRHRLWKKLWSRALRIVSLLLVSLAAIVSLLKIFSSEAELRLLQYLEWLIFGSNGVSPGCNSCDHSGFAAEAALVLIGAAGGFNLIDRFAGLSTGWMRYVKNAMLLHKELIKFQFEWTRLERKATGGQKPTAGDAPPAAAPAQSSERSESPDEPAPDAEDEPPEVERVSLRIKIDGSWYTRDIDWGDQARLDLTLRRIDLVQDFCSAIFTIVEQETSEWSEELKDNVTKFTRDVISHHGREAGRA